MRRFLALATLVIVVAALLPASIAEANQSGPFQDVPDDHIFARDIEWLAEVGITHGCNPPENTLFCPGDPVTRGQMAAFLHRGLEDSIPPTTSTSSTTTTTTTTTTPSTTTTSSTTTSSPTTTTTTLPDPNVDWSCSQSFDDDWLCDGDIDKTDSANEFWSCSQSFDGDWLCDGHINRSDSVAEFWSCSEVSTDDWDCNGDIDKTDSADEFWSCSEVGTGDWDCDGDIDKTDSADEFWSCSTVFGDWDMGHCEGEVYRADFNDEFWACDESIDGDWNCGGDVGFRAAIVLPLVPLVASP